jgi:glycosyltransferase involved in cell wall biosynthesis
MRVVVNCLAAAGRKAGIGHYAVQLVRGLRHRAGEDQIEVFPSPWIRGLCGLCDRYKGSARSSKTPLQMGGVRRKCFREFGRALLHRHFRQRHRPDSCDLYHEPNFIPLPSDLPTVATLHDLSVLLYPEWHPADRVTHYERHFRAGLEQCVHFFTDSDYTRQEIIRTLNLPPERITRTYVGVRPDLRPLSAQETARVRRNLGLPPRYLLYMGTLEPRKNILMLMRVYCSLPAAARERWPLVLVGGWGWRTEAIADYYENEARYKNVRRLGYVADDQVAAIYNGARALVYPSLYEGFGMPPMEMLACGGAVLASTAGPIVETVGRQAHLIPAVDFDGWRAALMRVVTDDDWCQSLRQGAVEVARPYTWDRCAAETLRVYRKICGIAAAEPRAIPALNRPRRLAG